MGTWGASRVSWGFTLDEPKALGRASKDSELLALEIIHHIMEVLDR